MEELIRLDKLLLFAVNSLHSSSLDAIMMAITHKFFWVPMYLVVLVYLYRRYKKHFLFLVLTIAVLITVSEKISSGLCKPYFKRLRPCHDTSIAINLHVPDGACGGLYGFVSSHASDTFALALFLSLFFRNGKFSASIFLWAGLVSLSRVYLGVHYPGDILVGAILGMGLAAIAFAIYRKLLSPEGAA